MGSCVRGAVLSFLLLLLSASAVRTQDLAPALADRFSEGVAALKAGQLDAAEAAFRDVLRAGGTRAFVHHNLGIVLQQRGRHVDALNEFRAATTIDRAFGPSRLLAGTSLLALGRTREAVTDLESAVQLMPKEPSAFLQLADACERAGDLICLVNAYRSVVSLVPEESEYAYRLGKAYLKLSQSSYERIRAVDPGAARLSQALGLQYLQQGRADLAEPVFQAAARRDPSLTGVHLALAQIYLADGRLDDAARAIARELALEPESRAARDVQAAIAAARKP